MRKSTWVATILIVPALLALSLCAPAIRGRAQEKKQEPAAATPPPEFKIPPEESKRENPMKGSATAAEAGKRLYASQCAMCHGAGGDGKGDLVEPMKLTLRDYTDPAALKSFTDGDLFYILSKGKEKMPGEGARMRDDQRWQLVTFIRSLAKKPAEEKKP